MKNNSTKLDALIARALAAKVTVAATVSAHRNLALSFLAEAVSNAAKKLLSANEADIAAARKNGADEDTVERMRLDYLGIGTVSGKIRSMASCADPTDETDEWKRENGLVVKSMRVPLGVILTVGGENPKKTMETAAQCIKTGNVMLLVRSGLTPRTDAAFEELLSAALVCCGMSVSWMSGADYSPEALSALLARRDALDAVLLLGNRAQNSLLRKSTEIPIIESDYGTTHIYVDEGADVQSAAAGVLASKLSGQPTALNTVLVNWMVSDDFLPVLEGKAMAAGVELVGDARVRSTLHGIAEATEQDKTDAQDRLLLLTVNSLSDALNHIERYGTGLCEGIYTNSGENAQAFCSRADAGTLTLNAPFSRANGYDVGFGADVGISADKLRSRGPMGLYRLTTTKYILKG